MYGIRPSVPNRNPMTDIDSISRFRIGLNPCQACGIIKQLRAYSRNSQRVDQRVTLDEFINKARYRL